mmetsp:Transcript_26202/g.28195  ORF Transcript_26202/g.28195 Transcript_26202/m.28195 type:complete len:92 (+) Transcript_26202:139-414(+)
MGKNATAKHHRSCVINCSRSENVATSTKFGEFHIKAEVFTIVIDDTEVKIDKNNIKNFADLMKKGNNLQSQMQEQQDQIRKMQRQIQILMK